MKLIADTHTHTLMSGHAHSTAMEHIAAAKALLRENGIPETAVLNADAQRFAAKVKEITGRSFDAESL